MRSISTLLILLSLNLCRLCFAQENGEQPLQEVRGFSLVQYTESGEKKWRLNGKSAEVDEGRIKIDEVSAVAFGEKTALKLKAKVGDFDRVTKLAHLENDVMLKTTDGAILTADSLYWNVEERGLFTDDVVNIRKADFKANGKGAVCDLDGKSASLKKDVVANIRSLGHAFLDMKDENSWTVVTCDGPLEIDYKKNKATFRNNVEIEDVQGNIFADRVDIYFGRDTRRIRCAVARGNVRIVNGESTTYSEKAIYLVERARLVLPKRPRVVVYNGSSK